MMYKIEFWYSSSLKIQVAAQYLQLYLYIIFTLILKILLNITANSARGSKDTFICNFGRFLPISIPIAKMVYIYNKYILLKNLMYYQWPPQNIVSSCSSKRQYLCTAPDCTGPLWPDLVKLDWTGLDNPFKVVQSASLFRIINKLYIPEK